MRKLLIPLIITLLSLISNNCFAQFSGGTGTSTDPYLISNVTQLNYFSSVINGTNSANYIGKYFKLMYNLSGINTFIPIGNSVTKSFQGHFDGGGHTISNLTINSGTYIGLFGYISNATIEQIGVLDGNFSPITNGYAGGLVGYAVNSTISQCFSKVSLSVNNTSTSGGLIGRVNNSIINNCFFTIGSVNVNVNNTNTYIGGLIGYIENNSTISNCFSSPANFTNNSISGPLYGYCSTDSYIYNSYYYDNWRTQANGTPMNAQSDMSTYDFAVDLNACQNQTWRKIPNDWQSSYYPTLYWQVPPDWLNGAEIPGCGLDGGGTPNNPFRIRCVADLVTLSDNVNNNGITYRNQFLRVENYIDFNHDPTNTGDFSPIGTSNNHSFQGNFNGGGHIIKNPTLNSDTYTYVGLFGYISGATIDSLGIEGFIGENHNTDNPNYVGGLTGYAFNSQIKRCYVVDSRIGGRRYSIVGGLIGYTKNSIINNCYSRAMITNTRTNGNGTRYYGGFVGYLESTSISNSYSAPIDITNTNYRGSLVGGTNVTVNPTTAYFLPISGMTLTNFGIAKDSAEMKSGCFPVTLNGTQHSIVWYKAKSESVSGVTDGVNKGYPVLSWQTLTLSGGVIIPAGFEGNCLGYTTPFVGDINHKYQVDEIKDLIYISNMVANDTTYNEYDNTVNHTVQKYFIMTDDISFHDCTNDYSSLFNPIGISGKPFSGYFDGNRKAIANYKFSDATKDNIGLFGYIKGATIKNLGISNISIKAGNNVGGLVGNTEANSAIDACFVYGYINGKENVGGLVGNVTAAACNISQSFTNTTIDAQTSVGGIAGNYKGTISNSYSNSEIYSSTSGNNYVGGIIGLASAAPTLTNVYSVCKIIRNANGTTNTNFGKIIGNNIGNNPTCYSRDNVFVNCDNITPSGYNGTPMTNAVLRSTIFNTNWIPDYSDNINDGYPILSYQSSAVIPTSGLWPLSSPTNTASKVVIIKNQVQLKTTATNCPKCAYVKIEKGGELNNTTNLNLFGEYNRELYLGKWNLIGLSTYNKILSCLYNYADTPYKTFVKRFDYTNNNWQASTNQSTNTIIDINTKFDYGEGILVMPNYSLSAPPLTTSRIVSKGVLYNDTTLSYTFNNTSSAPNKFVSLANNYPASLDTTLLINNNSLLIQGRLIYVYDADKNEWNNNWQSTNRVTSIKPSEGFFIASASGTFNFKKSQIKNTSGAKNIIKSDLIYVKAFANNQGRESFLEFNGDADNGFDFNDGLMLFGNNYYSVEPFFKIPTQEINDSTTQLIKDAFSSLPYSTELDLKSQDNNDVSLEFSNIPSGIYVYLIDSLLSKVQCLNENPYYNIKVCEGNNGNRLTVLFTYNKSDAKGFFNNNSNEEIRIWNNNKDLNIEGKDLVKYEIYDIMGNKLLEQDISTNNYQTLLNLKTGVYIVRASSKTGLKSQKISVVSE